MERDSYIDGIRSAWLGEQFGAVFFQGLADRATSENMKAKWQTLAKLEAVTGEKMAEVLQVHGEPPTADGPIEVGDEILDQYTNTPHGESMLSMKERIEQALVRFDQLLAVAPDSDVPAVQFLVHHEQALLTFVENELAGNENTSLHDVEQLLLD